MIPRCAAPISEPETLLTSRPLLQVEEVCGGYGKKEILRGVSLSLNRGEVVAILGPNGAGKSTLLKVVAGLVNLTRGRITVDGRDLTSAPPGDRVAAGLGTFLQGGEVFTSLSVRANLELGALSLPRAEVRRRVDEAFARFPALLPLAKQRAGQLSGGQRQLLALAMVLMSGPRLLLLDEPSAGLAPSLVRGFLDRLAELNRECGLTLLIVEQNLAEVLRICHRACLLKNGVVVGEEAADGLLTSGRLEQLFFS